MNNSFDALISSASARWGVPFTWIKAVIGTESNFDASAYRAEPAINDASYGLMQILTGTARGLGFSGDVDELYLPEINIELGTKLLSQLRARHGADFRRVYSAYNSGRPDAWQSSSQVLHNVERAEEWLERVIEQHPEAAAVAAGGLGLGLFLLGIWLWKRRN